MYQGIKLTKFYWIYKRATFRTRFKVVCDLNIQNTIITYTIPTKHLRICSFLTDIVIKLFLCEEENTEQLFVEDELECDKVRKATLNIQNKRYTQY